MKKVLLSMFLLGVFFVGFDFAYCGPNPLVTEGPIVDEGTATTLSVSTSAWTKAPATSSLTGRLAVQVCNPSTNNASMFALVSDRSSSPTEAITVRPREIGLGSTQLIPVPDNHYLYLISIHTSAENSGVQEFK